MDTGIGQWKLKNQRVALNNRDQILTMKCIVFVTLYSKE